MNKLTKWILSRLLNKSCPDRIPRSGKSGKQVNCYSISIYDGDVPVMLVKSINVNGLSGYHFEGGGFRTEAVIPFSLYSDLSLRVEHYHGLVTHRYSGVWDYILHEWTWFYKLQSIYALAKNSVPQYFFNKKTLQIPQRMKVLESIISKQSEEPHKSFSSLDLMSYMYSIRWYLHPHKTRLRKRMDLYFLNSDNNRNTHVMG